MKLVRCISRASISFRGMTTISAKIPLNPNRTFFLFVDCCFESAGYTNFFHGAVMAVQPNKWSNTNWKSAENTEIMNSTRACATFCFVSQSTYEARVSTEVFIVQCIQLQVCFLRCSRLCCHRFARSIRAGSILYCHSRYLSFAQWKASTFDTQRKF